MAAAKILKSLKQQATCPRCQCFYTDPVTIKCGHSFCRSCFVECFDQGDTMAPCPVCKTQSGRRSLRPNLQLQDIVEQVRALSAQPTCEEHPGENLTLYCEKDETAICVVCSRSEKYRAHSKHIVPLEEAVQKRKNSLESRSKELGRQLKDLQDWTTDKKAKASVLESKFKRDEDRTSDAYKDLKQFLEEKKKQTLNILKIEKKKNLGKIQNKIFDVKKQQMQLRNIITEIDEKCKQKDLELMKDVKSLLRRCDNVKVQRPELNLNELFQSAQSHSSECASLKENIKTFKESFPAEQEPVILDPDTAHPNLILSEDGKAVKRTDQEQDRPDNPKRFTVSRCVLGRRGFTSGQHYWELELLQDDGWAVGVALESVGRKEQVTESPEGGIWALKGVKKEIRTPTSSPPPLSPHQYHKKLRVHLNYERGQVSVHNTDHWENLYTFSGAAFRGKVYPYFWIGEGECTGLCKRQKTMGGFHSKEEVLRVF